MQYLSIFSVVIVLNGSAYFEGNYLLSLDVNRKRLALGDSVSIPIGVFTSFGFCYFKFQVKWTCDQCLFEYLFVGPNC